MSASRAGTPVRGIGTKPSGECALSFGSLKTEEKTERQCGQFVAAASGSGRDVLSVNSLAGPPDRRDHDRHPSRSKSSHGRFPNEQR